MPEGFKPSENAPDLHFHWQSALGGDPLIGTESLAVDLMNAGYDLIDLVVQIVGRDHSGGITFDARRELERLPRGKLQRFEIPSYELAGPTEHISVALLSAAIEPDRPRNRCDAGNG